MHPQVAPLLHIIPHISICITVAGLIDWFLSMHVLVHALSDAVHALIRPAVTHMCADTLWWWWHRPGSRSTVHSGCTGRTGWEGAWAAWKVNKSHTKQLCKQTNKHTNKQSCNHAARGCKLTSSSESLSASWGGDISEDLFLFQT